MKMQISLNTSKWWQNVWAALIFFTRLPFWRIYQPPKESYKAVVEYWFENTDSNWLSCCHAKANPASGRVMEKTGFMYHHDTVNHKFDGTPVECKSYLLTRERYEHRKDLF